MSITIVTGIFKFPNKHDKTGDIYIEWMKNLYENVKECPMVIFTDEHYYEHVVKFRKGLDSTKIIKIKMEEFKTNKYKNYYEKCVTLDPERNIHNINLYMVWNQKSEFLKKACDENYFNSDYFIWMDTGMIRDKSVNFLLHSFPNTTICKKIMENCEIILLEMSNAWRNNVNLSNIFNPSIHNYIKNTIHIGGTTFMGTKSGIYKWNEDYYKLTDEYVEKGLFIGKDQNLMAHMSLLHNDYIKIINANSKNWVSRYQPNPWFYLVNLLTPNYITAYVHSGLGNQLFQIAAAYGLSRKYDRMCILTRFGGNCHSKINYLSTIFSKFITLSESENVMINETNYENICENVDKCDKNILLQGYFQDYRYFDEYKNDILDLFDYPTPLPENVKPYLQNSFYLHLRFGDFEGGIHNINQIPFYKKAIRTILEKHKTATFIVCFYDPYKTKDIPKYLENLCKDICDYSLNDMERDVPVKFLLVNESNELVTLNIFKNCWMGGVGPHSTFSWWGGYLNSNPNKEIYIPNQWLTIEHQFQFFYSNTINLKY